MVTNIQHSPASTTLNATTAGEQPAAPIGSQNKTKQKKETRPGNEVSISCLPSVCLPPVRHDHYHKARHRGLSWPHLYQQAGIKLSNYPPRPLTWPWTRVPFARLACSQMQRAGMWKHILMTVLFQSQVFVIAPRSLYTLGGSSQTQWLEGHGEIWRNKWVNLSLFLAMGEPKTTAWLCKTTQGCREQLHLVSP